MTPRDAVRKGFLLQAIAKTERATPYVEEAAKFSRALNQIDSIDKLVIETANSTLERIRQSFGKQIPALFFVGAAIETAMAEEIFEQLKDGRLDYAANLTVSHQLSGLAAWLISL